LPEIVPIPLAQIRPLVLGVSGQREQRNIGAVVKVDYTSATALSAPLQPPPQLSHATGPWNQVASGRIVAR
jgi:hypothetical protein